MATYSSINAWRIPWTEGATIYAVTELDTTERLTYTHEFLKRVRAIHKLEAFKFETDMKLRDLMLQDDL